MTVDKPANEQSNSEYVQLDSTDAIGTCATGTSASVATARPVALVQVIAPADIPEGFTFEADVDGKRFPVVVPAGGVRKGQTFTISLHDEPTAPQPTPPPMGKWKDGLCNCFTYGFCHPHLWTTWCWRPMALAQVMTRMRLNWFAEAGSVQEVARTFRNVFIGYIIYMGLDSALRDFFSAQVHRLGDIEYYFVEELLLDPNLPTSALVAYFIRKMMHLLFGLYMLLATCSTRRVIRERFNIPTGRCGKWEDCCCSFWCGCCTIMQMMRHTADYDTYRGVCCTDTGLPPHAPQIV